MKSIKIVVFGPDNSGKTTLCNLLQKEIPELIIKHSPGPIPTKEQVEFMESNLSSEDSIVFDRFPYIEEKVCGKVLRGCNNFSEYEVPKILSWLNRVSLFVFCFPGIDKIKAWGEREQMEGIKDNIDSLVFEYQKLRTRLESLGLKVIPYNYSKQEQINKVMELVKNEYYSRY